MQALIRGRFPDATFRLGPGEDPGSVWMWTTVDLDDPDQVTDLTIGRSMELLIDEHVSLLIIPVRPLDRVYAELEERHTRSSAGTGTG